MIDPLALSSAFATIVGLLSNFKQEKKDEQELTNKDFMEWLEQHNHNDIKTYILSNEVIASNIESLIKENSETLISKLNKIDDILSSLVSQIGGFKGIVAAIRPTSELSEQALSILKQLVLSGSTEFGKMINMRSGHQLFLISGGMITYDDPRFLDDDLNTLIKLGLLRLRIGSNGSEFYGVTRNALKLIEAIES